MLALTLLAAALSARADFKQTYARGLEAASDGKWSEVEARMREALAEESTPAAKMKIYGMRFEPYIPKYYLGLAAYRQGNCRVATDNWSDGATRAIIAGDSKLSGVISAGLNDCEAKLAATNKPPVTPPVAPTNAQTVAQQSPPTKPPVTPPVTPPVNKPPPQTPPTTPPVASTAPAALVNALDAYVAGRYEQASNLDVAQFADTRARFHALLVRSAARHVLAQLRGEAGAALLAQAQADIRAAKGLNPSAQPDSALYSPRYRQLYSATR